MDAALELEVDFFVIAGDLFDNPRPSSSTLTYVISELKRLKEQNIPVLAVNGSHDTSQMPETSILTPLDKAELIRFLPLYGGDGWSNEDCYVYGLFNYSSRLRLIQELPAFLRENPPRPEKPFNICVLHQGIEWSGISGPYAVEIRPDELPRGFQYYASGHLHRHAILRLKDSNSLFVYPGATETKEVRESDDKKGFCYVKVYSKDQVEIEHREIPARKFVRATLNCNNLSPSEITERVLHKLRELDCEGCVVALTLEGVLLHGFRRYQVDLNSILTAKEKALHVLVFNHLVEARLLEVSSARIHHQARDLHERILPYLEQFVTELSPHKQDPTDGVVSRGSQAEALWEILEASSASRVNSTLAIKLADKLTELAKTAPANR